MDPLTAILAFTGLSASLVTLLDVVVETSTKLLELRSKFKDAPGKILRLHNDLQNLGSLLTVIQDRLSKQEATNYPPSLRAICESFIAQLERDLKGLHEIIERSNSELSLPVGKRLKARARQVLADNTINEFHGRINTHIGYLATVQTIMNSHEIDYLRRNTAQTLDETKAIFRLMSSHMGLLNSLSKQQHKSLVLYQEDRATGQRDNSTHISWKYSKRRKTYDFGFGRLCCHFLESRVTAGSAQVQQKRRARQIKISFLAPPWLSRTAFLATIHLSSPPYVANICPSVHLQPVTINQNPELLEAIHSHDVALLEKVFREDKAQPSDMIMDFTINEPVTLLDASLRVLTQIIPWPHVLSRHKELFAFLINQMVSKSQNPESATMFFSGLIQWIDDIEVVPHMLRFYLQKLLEYNGLSLDPFCVPSKYFTTPGCYSFHFGGYEDLTQISLLPALVEGPLGFEGLKQCLCHQSHHWTLEDLTGRGRWYVALIVHTDQGFRQTLLARMRQFRSVTDGFLNSLLKKHCDLDDVVREVENSTPRERCVFMQTLAAKGTPPMLAPFLNFNIRLDDGDDGTINNASCLAIAAENSNWDVFEMLLRAGASPARAITRICARNRLEEQIFKEIFPRLVNHMSSIQDNITVNDLPDALTAVLKNNIAVEVRPDTPQILLRNNLFLNSRLHGCGTVYPCHSYMFWALCYNRIEALKGLLIKGPPLWSTIDEMFATDKKHFQSIKNYTWLTLAVELGRSECAKLILLHTGDSKQAVSHRDGANRSALQIAESSVMTSHPRRSVLDGLYWVRQEECSSVTASADNTSLLILRSAVGAEDIDEVFDGDDNAADNSGSVECQQALLPPFSSFLFTLSNQVRALHAYTTLGLSEIFPFQSRGLSHCEIIGCENLLCPYEQKRATAWRRSQWTKVCEMSYEAVLLRLSYVVILSVTVVYDMVALFVSCRDATKTRQVYWILVITALVLAVRVS